MSANALANAENTIVKDGHVNTAPLILIPAYNPDQDLLQVTNDLHQLGFSQILIIDDGSDQEHQWVFDQLQQEPYCIISRHAQNFGKGAALKTGLQMFLNDFPERNAVLTVNADKRHSPEAVSAVSNALETADPGHLVMGISDFRQMNLPLKNQFFKKTLQKILDFFLSQDVVDNQTGLRGISRQLAARFLTTPGDRFDYESNMITECQREAIPIIPIPIRVKIVKKRPNGERHPVRDALKIYLQFIKYITAAIISTIIDVVGFMIFVYIFVANFPDQYILYATVVSRVISLLFTYLFNNKTVFRSYTKNTPTLVKYTALCIANIFLSAYMVSWIFWLTSERMNLAVIKVMVSLILFFFNYILQKKWVFRSKAAR